MEQWSATEDASLADGIREFSTRWALIKVHKLPHRSVSSIRNRHQRIRKGSQGPPGRNRCQRCGQIKRGHSCIFVVDTTDRVADGETDEYTHDVAMESDEFPDDTYSRSSSPGAECEKNAQCEPAPFPTLLDIPTLAPGNGGQTFAPSFAPMCSYIFEDAPRFISETSVAEELGAFIESPMISLSVD